MYRSVWLIVLVLAAVVVAGCGGGGSTSSQPTAQPPTSQATPGSSSPSPASSPGGASSGSTIKIIGKDNLYEPVTVTIKAGQEYEFEFDNDAWQFGIDSWRNVGYGLWQRACYVTMV